MIKKTKTLMILTMILLSSCGQEQFDVANATPDPRSCALSHSSVGRTANFSTLQHNVSGLATIVSDCEIRIDNFNFDGGGVDVRVYGALNSNFSSGFSLSDDLVGSAANGTSFSVFLPEGTTLDDVNSLSIWCVAFGIDFGSLTF